eukprot:CAMPEP_0173185424 /NCGR_PEP_ID=MMETSP1141-20130122/9549_1 /TAXON_ID=483371 /ORGANISM="non described non described, Strain CCMP2298" /LENGTH=538 /DNA_ID=CAMNT_0014108955 /DNA_START=61 /DNA_END=1677 /DNA_ORIENTATION=-
MAGSIPRLLPFSGWDEWMLVKNGLYAEADAPAAQQALDIVGMWRLRGRVPHSVDSTALLVQLQLGDQGSFAPATHIHPHAANSPHRRSESELRLQYSAAVVRAVNGLVDPSQQGVFATSVLVLAGRMGLPGWLVELRHDATHAALPPLAVLRAAASALLVWYWDHYWEPQFSLLTDLHARSVSVCDAAASVSSSAGQIPPTPQQPPALLPSSPSFWSEFLMPTFIAVCLRVPCRLAQKQPGHSGQRGTQKARVQTQTEAQVEAQLQALLQAQMAAQWGTWGNRLSQLIRAGGRCSSLQLLFALLAASGDSLRRARAVRVTGGVIGGTEGPLDADADAHADCGTGAQAEEEADAGVVLQARWELGLILMWAKALRVSCATSLMAGGSGGDKSALFVLQAVEAAVVEAATGFIEKNMKSQEATASLLPLMQKISAEVRSCLQSETESSSCISARNDNSHLYSRDNGSGGNKRRRVQDEKRQCAAAVQSGGWSARSASGVQAPQLSPMESIESLQGYPLWPVGCLPGRHEAEELYLVREVE